MRARSRNLRAMRLASLLLLFCLATPAVAENVDLALVLAVDTSGSVDGREFKLQMDGIAEAFTSPDVISAALSGPHQKIAVNLMTWGDPDEQKYHTGWYIIASELDAQRFADIARTSLPRQGGGTGLGVAIGFGLTLLRNSGHQASREVIDVSGDGRESWELREPRYKLPQAQAHREAAGVTVNGLAIQTDEKDLAQYFRDNVIGGPGSFVIPLDTYDDYARAIHLKLLREILPPITLLE
jgi:hypothetical protein